MRGAKNYNHAGTDAFVVASHASSIRIEDDRSGANGQKIYTDEIKEFLLENGLDWNKNVIFLGCHTALDPGTGQPSFAEFSSRNLGVRASGADKYVWWYSNGNYLIEGRAPGAGPHGFLPNGDKGSLISFPH